MPENRPPACPIWAPLFPQFYPQCRPKPPSPPRPPGPPSPHPPEPPRPPGGRPKPF